ncbi:small secreted protein [Aspergillus luchuensis IFO 4308]|nr:small secreted protein [Aspergillus luchuensis IFO 4308]
MQTKSLLTILLSAALAAATVDPASSNTKGKSAKTSTAIQAAECSHNTRTSGTQTFAVFVTDHQYDSSYGAPYGTCKAYTCTAPTDSEMTDDDDDCWTFFWNDNGESSGVGTGCIRSPDDGTCGCEDSDGTFVYGGSNCS